MKGINDGIVHMLESNSEMTYYLNELYDGPDMVYTIMKNIRPLWDSIGSVSYTHLDVYKRQEQYRRC